LPGSVQQTSMIGLDQYDVLGKTLYGVYVIFLQTMIYTAGLMTLLVATDRFVHTALAIYYRKFARKPPEAKYKAEELPDMALYAGAYPMVVVQLPMFNETEVCEEAIDYACQLEWPTSRLKVQVMDDSTDELTRQLVDDKVLEWQERGFIIECLRRDNREGYKGGAMKQAMDEGHLDGYEFAAVFDADFRPDRDFLLKTVPYLNDNPKIGFVQARWTFTNSQASFLTRVQELSLNYHVKCEQYARFATGAFFNFNGTAGVWRLKCIEDSGGWNGRTTVEDMDLSLRCYLNGWRFIFLYDVECLNELPSSFYAYRKQQHRWSCGPMQLWRQAMSSVWKSEIPLWQKLYLNIFFFGSRMFATHFIALVFYCTIVPLSLFVPEVHIPYSILVYVPAIVTLSTAAFTPESWYRCVVYVLFENAMSVVKLGAVVSGLLELKNAHEWVVTTKKGTSKFGSNTQLRCMYVRELVMSIFVLTSAFFGLFMEHKWDFTVFLFFQGLVFLAFGLNMVDEKIEGGAPKKVKRGLYRTYTL